MKSKFPFNESRGATEKNQFYAPGKTAIMNLAEISWRDCFWRGSFSPPVADLNLCLDVLNVADEENVHTGLSPFIFEHAGYLNHDNILKKR